MDKLLSAAGDALIPFVPTLIASLVAFIGAWLGHKRAVLNAARLALDETLAEQPEADEEAGIDIAADKMQQSFVTRSMPKSRRKSLVAQLFKRMRESSRPPSDKP
jgi:hypothetical protein